MPVSEISSSQDNVRHTIRTAANASGGDFTYLLRQAEIESGLNPDAKARTSSATGLFQFTEGTWLKSLQIYGARHGLNQASNAISSNSMTGSERAALLDLRRNPEIATRMAAEYAADNARYLKSSGHDAIGPTELYLAHFLGPQGASRFLDGYKNTPDSSAAMALPRAAESNKTIFYKDGRAATYREIYNKFAGRFGDVGTPSPQIVALAGDILSGKPSSSETSIIPKDFQQAFSRFAKDEISQNSGVKNSKISSQSSIPALGRSTPASNGLNGIRQAPAEVQAIDKSAVDKDAMAKYLQALSNWNKDPSLQPSFSNSTGRDASTGLKS
jgi:hypothetical protein